MVDVTSEESTLTENGSAPAVTPPPVSSPAGAHPAVVQTNAPSTLGQASTSPVAVPPSLGIALSIRFILITQFFQWYKEKSLNLKPPYQRNSVWSDRSRSYLIDTVLKKLPLPEVFLRTTISREGKEMHEVVDGQQRIEAIMWFLDDHAHRISRNESAEFGGKCFSDLLQSEQQALWNYPIVVRDLTGLTDSQVEEVYRRLNKYVVPLTPQELRHATYSGPFIKLVEELAEFDKKMRDDKGDLHSFWLDNRIVGAYEVRRMRDVEYVSELLIGTMHGPQDGRKTLNEYYDLYDNPSRFDAAQWRRQFLRVQKTIVDIFGADKLNGTYFNKSGDFYSLFLATSKLLENHAFPDDCYPKIRKDLVEFRRRVVLEWQTSGRKQKRSRRTAMKDDGMNGLIAKYFDTVALGGIASLEHRKTRTQILTHLIAKHLIAKDPQRDFTQEQKEAAWALSKDKKCALCGKEVAYSQYHLDHKTPHSKSGKTELSNAQITHDTCNLAKGNQTP